MGEIVSSALAPHDDLQNPRFTVDGPDISLPPGAALALSLVVHELSTNAAKYGALRHDDGRVRIEWHRIGDEVALVWTEIDGPPVVAPQREGFGSLLIRRAFSQEFDPQTSFEFKPDGLRFTLSFKVTEAGNSLLPRTTRARISFATNSVR